MLQEFQNLYLKMKWIKYLMLNPPGIEKYIIKVINQLNNIGRQKLPYFCFIMSNKNYAVGHAFTSHDLFFNFPVNKLNMTT